MVKTRLGAGKHTMTRPMVSAPAMLPRTKQQSPKTLQAQVDELKVMFEYQQQLASYEIVEFEAWIQQLKQENQAPKIDCEES